MGVPLNIDWQQILLHMFNLIILFGALYFILYKPVKDFMDKREQYYKDMDDKAKENLEESRKAKTEYEEKLSQADIEIAKIREKNIEEAKNMQKDILDKAKVEGEEIISTARRKASEEHDRIISGAKEEITELIAEATSKVVGGEDVSDSYESFLDSVGK